MLVKYFNQWLVPILGNFYQILKNQCQKCSDIWMRYLLKAIIFGKCSTHHQSNTTQFNVMSKGQILCCLCSEQNFYYIMSKGQILCCLCSEQNFYYILMLLPCYLNFLPPFAYSTPWTLYLFKLMWLNNLLCFIFILLSLILGHQTGPILPP